MCNITSGPKIGGRSISQFPLEGIYMRSQGCNPVAIKCFSNKTFFIPTDMRRRQVYSPVRNELRFLRQERLEDNVYIPPEAPIIDIIQVDTYLIGKYHFVVVLLRIAYTGKQLFLVSIL